MAGNEWLANLKAGDTVIEHRGYGVENARPAKVERTTATQIVVGLNRYRKKDGRESCGQSYSNSWISVGDESLLAEIVELAKRRSAKQAIFAMADKLRHFGDDTPSTGLEEIAAVMLKWKKEADDRRDAAAEFLLSGNGQNGSER